MNRAAAGVHGGMLVTSRKGARRESIRRSKRPQRTRSLEAPGRSAERTRPRNNGKSLRFRAATFLKQVRPVGGMPNLGKSNFWGPSRAIKEQLVRHFNCVWQICNLLFY